MSGVEIGCEFSPPAQNTRYKSRIRKHSSFDKMEGIVASKKSELIQKWCENIPEISSMYASKNLKCNYGDKTLSNSDVQTSDDDSWQEVLRKQNRRSSEISFKPTRLSYDKIGMDDQSKIELIKSAPSQSDGSASYEEDSAEEKPEESLKSIKHLRTNMNTGTQSTGTGSTYQHKDNGDHDNSSHHTTEHVKVIAESKMSQDNPSSTESEETVIEQLKRRLQEQDQTVFFELFELLLTKIDTVRDVRFRSNIYKKSKRHCL